MSKGSVLNSTSHMSKTRLCFETSAVQISLRDSWQDCCCFSCCDSRQDFWRGRRKLDGMSVSVGGCVASLAHSNKTLAENLSLAVSCSL